MMWAAMMIFKQTLHVTVLPADWVGKRMVFKLDLSLYQVVLTADILTLAQVSTYKKSSNK